MRLTDRPVRKAVASARVTTVEAGTARSRPDRVVTEEPMEIRVHGPGEPARSFAVTMRTPGHDFELAVGFCLTEGLLEHRDDLDGVAYCLGGDGEQEYNVVTVRLRRPTGPEVRERRVLANASCGVCGKAALDEVAVRCEPVAGGPTVAASTLVALPRAVEGHQRVFDQTGGLHAAARFAADGSLIAAREDVGRHNALDKLIGHACLDDALPTSGEILFVSGRLGFELVQKAAVAGFPVICAVSAPTSLAVATAERFGQTIIGFLRGQRFNVYSHPRRIDPAA